jgi:nitroreductase
MFLSMLKKRRSIRKFEEKEIEKEKIDKLIEAALRSPSSRGLNPWEFIVVTDRELLDKLSRSKEHGSSFLMGAPLGIVVIADPEKCDVWVEDCSVASIIIHLTAESLGLGSCWIQIRERMHDEQKTAEEYIREVLEIPGKYKVESIIGIGYPAEEKPSHSRESLSYDKLHRESFGRSF